MRAMLLVCVMACGSPQAAAPTEPPAFGAIAPQLDKAEQLSWTVFWQDIEVGQADLVVDRQRADTRFRTSPLARALVDVNYELTTVVDGGASTMSESLTRNGTSERIDARLDGASYRIGSAQSHVAPGGNRLHTLHTALGGVRAWSRRNDGTGGYLWLVHRGELYRLDVFPARRDDLRVTEAVRIDGVVRAFDRSQEVELSIWLSADADRMPLQIAARLDGQHLAAELVR